MIGKLAKSRRCVWICAVEGRLRCTFDTAASARCSVSSMATVQLQNRSISADALTALEAVGHLRLAGVANADRDLAAVRDVVFVDHHREGCAGGTREHRVLWNDERARDIPRDDLHFDARAGAQQSVLVIGLHP